MFQLANVSLRVGHHLPPVQLLAAHLTSLLPLNQHLKSFNVLLEPKKGKLAHQFDCLAEAISYSELFCSFPRVLQTFFSESIIIFFHVVFPLQSGKTVTIRETEVHKVFVKNMPSSQNF